MRLHFFGQSARLPVIMIPVPAKPIVQGMAVLFKDRFAVNCFHCFATKKHLHGFLAPPHPREITAKTIRKVISIDVAKGLVVMRAVPRASFYIQPIYRSADQRLPFQRRPAGKRDIRHALLTQRIRQMRISPGVVFTLGNCKMYGRN